MERGDDRASGSLRARSWASINIKTRTPRSAETAPDASRRAPQAHRGAARLQLSAAMTARPGPYGQRGPGAVSLATGKQTTPVRSLGDLNRLSLPILYESPIPEQRSTDSLGHASNEHLGDRRSQLQVRELAGSLGAVGRARSLLLRRTLLLCVIRPGRRARANRRKCGSGVVHCSVVREAQHRWRGSRHI